MLDKTESSVLPPQTSSYPEEQALDEFVLYSTGWILIGVDSDRL
jgi:hypothetical protein